MSMYYTYWCGQLTSWHSQLTFSLTYDAHYHLIITTNITLGQANTWAIPHTLMLIQSILAPSRIMHIYAHTHIHNWASRNTTTINLHRTNTIFRNYITRIWAPYDKTVHLHYTYHILDCFLSTVYIYIMFCILPYLVRYSCIALLMLIIYTVDQIMYHIVLHLK